MPDISDRIEETKRRIEEGDFMGAQEVIPTTLKQKSYRPQAEYPLPLCEVNITFNQSDVTTDFSRSLDMEKGEATISYNVAETKYKRNIFVSRADNLIAYRITKQGGGTISFKLNIALMHRVNARTYEGIVNMPEGDEARYDRQFVTFASRNDDNGTDYGVVASLHVLGGSIRPEEDHVEIVHAQSVLILIKTFTNGLREREWSKIKKEKRTSMTRKTS